jgi:preprotein translocase subunit SecF
VVSTVGFKGQSAFEFSFGGGNESNFAEVTIELLDGKEYARASHKEIQRRIRPMLDVIPGAAIRFRPLAWGPPVFAPIAVKIIGPEIETLRRLSATVKDILDRIPGATDVKDDFSDAPPELRVEVDRERSAALGVPLDTVATSLRGATAGLDIREFQDELDVSRKYDLRVRYSPESRTSTRMLDKVRVRSSSGALVPLSNIATFSQGPGINHIRHVDRRRVVRVSASNEGRSAVEISKELQAKLADVKLPEGYLFDFSGEHEETEESFASLKLAYLIAFILIFTLLVTQFNSYFQPLAIMTALPLSVVGAMFGLLITGNNFSIMSFVGLVGLTGIVVNDSIVLVDCINRIREKGVAIFDAIVAAGQQRLRPIISTTLSTIGGIITLTITDKLWEGLGVVIIFGIAFATMLTLVVVPVMYLIFESMGYRFVSAFRGPRYKVPPEGRSFFYSRRRYARIWLLLIGLLQLGALGLGVVFLAPHVKAVMASTTFQAPNLLKLSIEIIVFALTLGLEGIGILLLLMLPTWLGLLFLMGRRTSESQYIEVTSKGIILTSPTERLFLPGETIQHVHYSRWTQRLMLRAGGRHIKIRKVIEVSKKPVKVPLTTWLREPAPARSDIRTGMDGLNQAIEQLMAATQLHKSVDR